MPQSQFTLFDGRLHVYKRDEGDGKEGRVWQCATYLAGKNWRVSTKSENREAAKDFAEDWYMGLRGKAKNGDLKVGKTFKAAADKFLLEYPVLTAGERNETYVESKNWIVRVHLMPFFGDKTLAEITPGLVGEYRMRRLQDTTRTGKAPTRSTLHKEIVCLRQILKTACAHGWMPYVPNLASPYKASGKISHRAWFSKEEYKLLFEATRRRAEQPLNNRHRWACEQLHDYVLFMANTGLRPDEARRLEYRDVSVVKDADTRQVILEIEVRGKRGIGWCKSMPSAVIPFTRLQERNTPKDTDKIFPGKPRELLNTILDELNLKHDRDGNPRTAYSLRHSYICFRLMEGADIYQVAKNCRTSVEMIEKFYATHIKNMLDASSINVQKSRRRARTSATA